MTMALFAHQNLVHLSKEVRSPLLALLHRSQLGALVWRGDGPWLRTCGALRER